MGDKIKVSAIICTYNRAKYLGPAIDSLLDQTVPLSDYELIIVDNASTDDTARIAKGYGSKVKYIFEPNQGLSYARNAGFKNSRAEIVAYMDDDAIACRDWIENIIKAFSIGPEIGAAGGKIEPIWEGKKPRWATKELYPHFSCQDKGPNPFYLKEYDYFFGGNAAYRKEILYNCGGFPVKLGRIGKMQLAHEEWPVFNYINEHKLKKYYLPGIKIDHTVMRHRLNLRWMMNRFYWLGASAVYHDRIYGKMKRTDMARKYYRLIPAYFTRKTKPIMYLLNITRFVGIFYSILTCSEKKQAV